MFFRPVEYAWRPLTLFFGYLGGFRVHLTQKKISSPKFRFISIKRCHFEGRFKVGIEAQQNFGGKVRFFRLLSGAIIFLMVSSNSTTKKTYISEKIGLGAWGSYFRGGNVDFLGLRSKSADFDSRSA